MARLNSDRISRQVRASFSSRRFRLKPLLPSRSIHVRKGRKAKSFQHFVWFIMAIFFLNAVSMMCSNVQIIHSIKDQTRAIHSGWSSQNLHQVRVESLHSAQEKLSASLSSRSNDSSLPTLGQSSSPVSTEALTNVNNEQLTCYKQRDIGLIDQLRAFAISFCSNDPAQTKVTLLSAPGNVRATVFSALAMDFRLAKVSRPISSLAEDGGNHDPRFVYDASMIHCSCPELGKYARSRETVNLWVMSFTTHLVQPLRLWHPALAGVPEHQDDLSALCSSEVLHSPPVSPSEQQPNRTAAVDRPELVLSDRAIVIARKDDHNPFFQISSAFNAWILMKTLNWSSDTTQVVHLDDGYASPVDSLHHQLLAPTRPIIVGSNLMGKLVQFKAHVLLPPFESDGPLMQDLNSDSNCYNTTLVQDFRLASLQALNVTTPVVSNDSILVTIISRRPYSGRIVQRKWLNEHEVLESLRQIYVGRRIRFQSIDFVALDLRQQMLIMLESDVVIGMHGAGLVNVLWTQPNTLVVEIFPHEKKRWGYRNICQHIGCNYHEFRGGIDVPTNTNDPNANDKIIPSQSFAAFFTPLLQIHLATQGRTLSNFDI